MTKYVVFGKVDENGQYPFLDKRQKGYWIDKTFKDESPAYAAYQFNTSAEARIALNDISEFDILMYGLRIYALRDE